MSASRRMSQFTGAYEVKPSVRTTVSDAALLEMFEQFKKFDIDGDGHIDLSELGKVVKLVNPSENYSQDALRRMIREADTDLSGTIEFSEFVEVCSKLKQGAPVAQQSFGAVVQRQATLMQVQGASGIHTFSEEEKVSFVNHINDTLRGDPHLPMLPINPDNLDIFASVRNGILLAKLINRAVPGTIDVRALNTATNINTFQINENQNLVINSAKAIGCTVVNIGAADLVNGTEHLVLGLIWQIIKIQLLSSITLANHPELCRLLEPGEDLASLLKLTPEQILLRWFNYHLKRAGSQRVVTNLTRDIQDSECYTILLTQISGGACNMSPMQQTDAARRAEAMLAEANKIDCRKFVSPMDVVRGHQRLNLAYTANLFNTHPALEPLSDDEYKAAGLMDDDEGDSREARAFKMWINSLGIDTYVNNIFEDMSDGIVLLQVLDKVRPGIVSWPRVNIPATSIFKKVENTNYAVLLGKQLNFSLVNIGGKDICDKNKKLILGFVWQLMRLHVVSFLKALRPDGREVDEEFMISWSNQRVGSRYAAIQSFRDPTLRNSLYIFHLLSTVEPRAINWELVTAGVTPEDCELNAKYAISVARKVDCCIFLLWEDIVDVKPKMLMTFIGAIMATAQRLQH